MVYIQLHGEQFKEFDGKILQVELDKEGDAILPDYVDEEVGRSFALRCLGEFTEVDSEKAEAVVKTVKEEAEEAEETGDYGYTVVLRFDSVNELITELSFVSKECLQKAEIHTIIGATNTDK